MTHSKKNTQKHPPKADLLEKVAEFTAIEEELKDLQGKVKDAEEKAHKMEQSYKRALADLDNYRRRTEEEKKDFAKYAATNLLLELLPAYDNFRKAVEFIPKNQKKEAWVEGIIHSLKFFELTLERQGVERIKAVGDKLDHNVHDAVLQAPGKQDIILEEVECGYKYHGKIIKHSKVKVGNGE